ncbi:phenylalanyl-tRNA synthetase subunit beta [Neisseria gonorrhoeae]|uniref:Phenylalanyl-tRNA synthetase subunit beta n=1 Tax=Neisseria gonorrhoeae TaxID=485 RepID=A0A378W0V3_NEIGO|nr:phenylalanyl-tRNA synthetase subunit beta [Neisseria gonorrhoeae]
MQFSYSWLKTQANPDLSADKLEHLLTMAGLEVEEIDTAALLSVAWLLPK